MKLNDYEEIVGTLENYTQEQDSIKLVFKIQTTIELPVGAITKDELDDCISRKIGIFNSKGDYRLRKFPTPIENFKNENCPSCEKQNQCSRDGEELFYCLLNKVCELHRNKQASNLTGSDLRDENKKQK